MKQLFRKHVGQEIGINLTRAHRIESARLIAVEDDYFSVDSPDDGNRYHILYSNIVKVVENADGVKVGGLFVAHKTHPFVVKIGHVVEYAPT